MYLFLQSIRCLIMCRSTAVARGAVLRALNKRFGPRRITQSSYGFLISEPYEPDYIEAHKKTVCRINPADGLKYVDGTIRWMIQAVSELYPRKEAYTDSR
jgi:hypothetical protein